MRPYRIGPDAKGAIISPWHVSDFQRKRLFFVSDPNGTSEQWMRSKELRLIFEVVVVVVEAAAAEIPDRLN